jgi:hypothetical protein
LKIYRKQEKFRIMSLFFWNWNGGKKLDRNFCNLLFSFDLVLSSALKLRKEYIKVMCNNILVSDGLNFKFQK